MKFLKLGYGNLINVEDIKEIMKSTRLNVTNSGGVKRVLRATIELRTSNGIYPFLNVKTDAAMKEGESWSYGTEGGRRAIRRIDDILDTMLVLLIDKMNDENEKIIDIDIRFLEEAMQEEVDRG